jgi:hypothetical protein
VYTLITLRDKFPLAKRTNKTDTEKVQAEINSIITAVRAKGWRMNKPTQKALRKVEELGLTSYMSAWARADVKCDAIVNAVIAAAEDAGSHVSGGGFTIDGDGETYEWDNPPSALYQALNNVPDAETEEVFFGLNEQEQQEYDTTLARMQEIVDAAIQSERETREWEMRMTRQVLLGRPETGEIRRDTRRWLNDLPVALPDDLMQWHALAIHCAINPLSQREPCEFKQLTAKLRSLDNLKAERRREGNQAKREWQLQRDHTVRKQSKLEAQQIRNEWGATLDGVYQRGWPGGIVAQGSKLFTYCRVENGMCVEAWVDAPMGNGSGYAGNYEGKTQEELVELGFTRIGPFIDWSRIEERVADAYTRSNPAPRIQD